MSLGRMEVGRHMGSVKRKGKISAREREGEQKGDEPKGCGRRAKENAAALPANSRRPAIFTRPIK